MKAKRNVMCDFHHSQYELKAAPPWQWILIKLFLINELHL